MMDAPQPISDRICLPYTDFYEISKDFTPAEDALLGEYEVYRDTRRNIVLFNNTPEVRRVLRLDSWRDGVLQHALQVAGILLAIVCSLPIAWVLGYIARKG